MPNTLKQMGENIWDMLGLSSYKRNAAFLKKCGVEEEYTREQHAAYLQAMEAAGQERKSVPHVLFAHRCTANSDSDLGKRWGNTLRMAEAVNTLEQVTNHGLTTRVDQCFLTHAMTLSIQSQGERVYSRFMWPHSAFSEVGYVNPWVKERAFQPA